MRVFLLKIFVKQYQNTGNPQVRESYGRLAGAVGIVSNLFLCILKIAVGALFHSIAILADGINNLSDASSSIITLVGFRMAAKPSDDDHPYGHERIEYITGLIVSLLILILGIQLCLASIQKIRNPEPLEFSWITIVILIVAILVKLWQSRFNIKMGEAIDSATLKATGMDSRNDVVATSVILLGILIGKITHVQLDGWLGVLVALFIVWSGFQLIRETADPLLGQAPDPTLVDAISSRIISKVGVLGLHDLVIHDYGPGRVFASVHVEVDARTSIVTSHDIIDNIEREIRSELQIELVIHMDPLDPTDPLIAELRSQIQAILADIDPVITMHDLRVVAGCTHRNVVFDIVIPQGFSIKEADLKAAIDDKIKEINPIYYTVITIDRSYQRHGQKTKSNHTDSHRK